MKDDINNIVEKEDCVSGEDMEESPDHNKEHWCVGVDKSKLYFTPTIGWVMDRPGHKSVEVGGIIIFEQVRCPQTAPRSKGKKSRLCYVMGLVVPYTTKVLGRKRDLGESLIGTPFWGELTFEDINPAWPGDIIQ